MNRKSTVRIKDWIGNSKFTLYTVWVFALVYSAYFMFKGWIPHDEGNLAQSAERVLQGQLPHIDFDETYSGGLTFLHALSFKIWGIRLASMRIQLYLFFAVFVLTVYEIARRMLSPLVSGLVVFLAIAWGLPNYFAPLPSWYVLFFSAFGSLCVLKYIEEEKPGLLLAGGFFGGAAFLMKLPGLYYIAAVFSLLVYRSSSQLSSRAWKKVGKGAEGAFRITVSAGVLLLALLLLKLIWPKIDLVEAIHFGVPGWSICLLMLAELWRKGGAQSRPGKVSSSRFKFLLKESLIFSVGVALPVLAFLFPFWLHHGLYEVYRGIFVTPQLRYEYAFFPLPSIRSLFLAIPAGFFIIATLFSNSKLSDRKEYKVLFWAMNCLLVMALIFSERPIVYHMVWASVRPLVPILVVAGSLRLFLDANSTNGQLLGDRQKLFFVLALLAFFSLIQFPYSFGIYFCYTAALVVLAWAYFVVPAKGEKRIHLCFALFFSAFGIVWLNPGTVRTKGQFFRPNQNEQLLLPQRAGLEVSKDDLAVYTTVIDLVLAHSGDSRFIYAAPDSPEIYFLAGKENPTRIMYDFFDPTQISPERILKIIDEHKVPVVVLNSRPEFSPKVQKELYDGIESRFRSHSDVGWFRVFWKSEL